MVPDGTLQIWTQNTGGKKSPGTGASITIHKIVFMHLLCKGEDHRHFEKSFAACKALLPLERPW